jgi:SAM-dependent methyltransferase
VAELSLELVLAVVRRTRLEFRGLQNLQKKGRIVCSFGMSRVDGRRYVFSDVNHERELQRLREIEAIFDEDSHRVLLEAGVAQGSHCLEVGAGAGSIAYWMSDVVGPGGRVVALDVNTQWMAGAGRANLEVRQDDIRSYDANETFDIVHARYVLLHVADFRRALERMVSSIRPGGWLVLEEPDFTAARCALGPSSLAAAFERVHRAIQRMYAMRSMDPAFGFHLPRYLADAGLATVQVEHDAPIVRGGSGVPLMMRRSAEQLREKYVATGVARGEDVDDYYRFTEDATTWAVYYGTVRATARKTT